MGSILLCVALLLCASCNNTPAVAPEPSVVTLEDLEGKTVAVLEGSTSDVLLSDTHNFSNVTLVRCATPTEMLAAMDSNLAEYGITDTVVLMARQKSHDALKVLFNLPGGFDVAVAFNHRDVELCREFNDFLVQIKSDGTLDEMFSRWCSSTIDTVHMPPMPELEELKGHPIEVATLTDNPPFSFYRENHWTGLEVEIMMRFSQHVKRPVHFSGYLFNEIISVLRERKADMAAANMFITPDRADQILFSHPYYLCKTCCCALDKQ